MLASVLAPCLVALMLMAAPLAGYAADSRPAPGKNNVWYHANDEAETAIVFVHGLGSDSRGAWFHEGHGVEDDAYWPELVKGDPTFDGSAIFLGGFHSRFDSHDYDFRDAANELHRALLDRIDLAAAPVLDRQNILFVAHSAGGIVVRDMLIRKAEDFSDKAVGLVLIASPSIGAPDADRLRFIADFVRSKQGRDLEFSSAYLTELDKNFKNLVHDRRLSYLVGEEWLEHHMMISKFFGIWRDSVLVDENTAARYFGESVHIPGSDHLTIVKPTGFDHDSHRALRVFYRGDFGDAVDHAAAALEAKKLTRHPAPPSQNPSRPIEDPIIAQGPSRPTVQSVMTHQSVDGVDLIRIDEKGSAAFCGDRVHVEVTSVWKQGGGKPDGVVTLSSSALDQGKAIVKIGQKVPLGGDCAPTLVDTGRDAKYYANFR